MNAKMLMGEEVSIPMPWGIMSGKAWGVEGGNPTLCIHGYNENAAAFDALLSELLNKMDFFLAIDLPGHGKSDHYPISSQLTDIEYVADIRRICHHYGWSHINILAYSLGSRISMYFAGLFPQIINKLIILDLTHGTILYDPSHICDVAVHEVNALIRYEKVQQNIGHTKEEALKRFKNSRIVDLKRDEYLLNIFLRSTKNIEDKWYFSGDRRNIKLITPLITEQFHTAIISHILCPTLIIMSTESSMIFERVKVIGNTFNILKKVLKNKLTIIETNYSHGMHIDEAENISLTISGFLRIHNKL